MVDIISPNGDGFHGYSHGYLIEYGDLFLMQFFKRDKNREHRPAFPSVFNVYISSVLVYDAVAYGEPQPRTFSLGFIDICIINVILNSFQDLVLRFRVKPFGPCALHIFQRPSFFSGDSFYYIDKNPFRLS